VRKVVEGYRDIVEEGSIDGPIVDLDHLAELAEKEAGIEDWKMRLAELVRVRLQGARQVVTDSESVIIKNMLMD
jgi:hypothetical protein